MDVRIYQPSKTAMQSGRSKTSCWLLEYELETARTPDTLMGWVSSGDTNNQVRLKFSSQAEAVAFAEKEGWRYTLVQPHQRRVKPRNYSDNFKYTPPAKAKKS
ncbi:MAG: ETC complex I subunit [Alphaproteobacteria bacterium]|nr:ETC complex I subunit [Alphaproteobacteria bacterium]MCD8570562.1 ETC complex I subunit [Alphaproteobacteria bacterium]